MLAACDVVKLVAKEAVTGHARQVNYDGESRQGTQHRCGADYAFLRTSPYQGRTGCVGEASVHHVVRFIGRCFRRNRLKLSSRKFDWSRSSGCVDVEVKWGRGRRLLVVGWWSSEHRQECLCHLRLAEWDCTCLCVLSWRSERPWLPQLLARL